MSVEVAPRGLYSRLLGEDWERLCAAVQGLHCEGSARFRASGVLKVTRGRGPLVWLMASLMRLPPASQSTATHLEVTREGAAERWSRSFGAARVVTVQRAEGGILEERFGPSVLRFRLSVTESGGLRYEQLGAGLGFGRWTLPLPRWMAPRVSGFEGPGQREGRTRLDISIGAPGLGLLVRYEGWMEREETP